MWVEPIDETRSRGLSPAEFEPEALGCFRRKGRELRSATAACALNGLPVWTWRPYRVGVDVQLVTVEEFARLARLSRRQIDRLRRGRPPGFPREYELSSGASKFRRCPRFKLSDVQQWLESRAAW